MLSVSQLQAKYPSARFVDSASVSQLRADLVGHMVTRATTKAQLSARLKEILAATPSGPDQVEAAAVEAVESRTEFVNALCLLEPAEVLAQLTAKGYAPKTMAKYLELMAKAGYQYDKELRRVMRPVFQECKEQANASLAERHKSMASSEEMEEWAKQCFRYAKNILANPETASPWDLALALQLVTGRRHSELARMVVANGMFMGKAKGKDGMYDGVWFPFYSFVSEPVLQRALTIVQAECGPNQTEAQRVKWNSHLSTALSSWPVCPAPTTPKVFRKVYAKVASALPQQFPMPTEWARYSTAARVAWLCGHTENDLATQNSYELFNCSATVAKTIRLSMSNLS